MKSTLQAARQKKASNPLTLALMLGAVLVSLNATIIGCDKKKDDPPPAAPAGPPPPPNTATAAEEPPANAWGFWPMQDTSFRLDPQLFPICGYAPQRTCVNPDYLPFDMDQMMRIEQTRSKTGKSVKLGSGRRGHRGAKEMLYVGSSADRLLDYFLKALEDDQKRQQRSNKRGDVDTEKNHGRNRYGLRGDGDSRSARDSDDYSDDRHSERRAGNRNRGGRNARHNRDRTGQDFGDYQSVVDRVQSVQYIRSADGVNFVVAIDIKASDSDPADRQGRQGPGNYYGVFTGGRNDGKVQLNLIEDLGGELKSNSSKMQQMEPVLFCLDAAGTCEIALLRFVLRGEEIFVVLHDTSARMQVNFRAASGEVPDRLRAFFLSTLVDQESKPEGFRLESLRMNSYAILKGRAGVSFTLRRRDQQVIGVSSEALALPRPNNDAKVFESSIISASKVKTLSMLQNDGADKVELMDQINGTQLLNSNSLGQVMFRLIINGGYVDVAVMREAVAANPAVVNRVIANEVELYSTP